MALTDTKIRSTKPGERDQKLGDGGGLYRRFPRILGSDPSRVVLTLLRKASTKVGSRWGSCDNVEGCDSQMALTDTAIRAAKLQVKQYKLYDERGLLMLVWPSGGKLWRFQYRVHNKEQFPSVPSTSKWKAGVA